MTDLCGATKRVDGRLRQCLNGANHKGAHRYAARFSWSPPTLAKLGSPDRVTPKSVCVSCGATTREDRYHQCAHQLGLPLDP